METKAYYSVTGKQGEAEWRKDIIRDAWRLYDAAIDLVYQSVKLEQYEPAKKFLGFAVSALEAKQTDEALYWFGEAKIASVDVIQKDQIEKLVNRIKGE